MDSAKWVQAVGQLPLVGSALRWYARRYPEGSVVTIKHGVAAGCRWRRHHRYVNGYWIGQYELEIQQALRRRLRPGQTFYDVGANAGFFTLVANRLVGPSGRCVAVDPSPENVQSVREQVELNALDNCHVVPAAVGAEAGVAEFSFALPGSPQGHLGGAAGGETSISVDVLTFDDLTDRFGPPDFIKMDIEGAEIAALKGAARLLRDVRPDWLVEHHGPACEAEVRRVLSAAGYAFFSLDDEPLPGDSVLPSHFIAAASR